MRPAAVSVNVATVQKKFILSERFLVLFSGIEEHGDHTCTISVLAELISRSWIAGRRAQAHATYSLKLRSTEKARNVRAQRRLLKIKAES